MKNVVLPVLIILLLATATVIVSVKLDRANSPYKPLPHAFVHYDGEVFDTLSPRQLSQYKEAVWTNRMIKQLHDLNASLDSSIARQTRLNARLKRVADKLDK